jgi:dihydroorotase-like cyclic amidohydrolase
MIERLENSLGPDAPPRDQQQLVKEISAAAAASIIALINKQLAENPLKTTHISAAEVIEILARARESVDKGDK